MHEKHTHDMADCYDVERLYAGVPDGAVIVHVIAECVPEEVEEAAKLLAVVAGVHMNEESCELTGFASVPGASGDPTVIYATMWAKKFSPVVSVKLIQRPDPPAPDPLTTFAMGALQSMLAAYAHDHLAKMLGGALEKHKAPTPEPEPAAEAEPAAAPPARSGIRGRSRIAAQPATPASE